MRRARYIDFYKTFEPHRSSMTAESTMKPRPRIESVEELRRARCLEWKPQEHFVRIIDSKQREWLVFDATNDGAFRSGLPLASQRALVRLYWREDHVRMRYIHDERDRTRDLAMIRKQLRSTYRVDQREDVTRSPTTAIQDLYDSRGGMGRT
jgi:hypothetical protein